jgi:hypothetical protein
LGLLSFVQFYGTAYYFSNHFVADVRQTSAGVRETSADIRETSADIRQSWAGSRPACSVKTQGIASLRPIHNLSNKFCTATAMPEKGIEKMRNTRNFAKRGGLFIKKVRCWQK